MSGNFGRLCFCDLQKAELIEVGRIFLMGTFHEVSCFQFSNSVPKTQKKITFFSAGFHPPFSQCISRTSFS